jgi:DNA mismatch repair ATPase MutS
VQLAFAIESWRRAHGGEIARWLDAVGEIEALAALASHAYEHPADPFPEIRDEGPLFAATGLGHPLIPERDVVPNDVHLDRTRQVLVVSGSNMSGKSTLLRTVGVNTVLALAGGTVRARHLALSPLMVGATIGIHDSLKAGVSRFYAEITRLKQLTVLARDPLPVLFLLDELLHGTNSHDRKIGAEAIVRSFVARGAIGLVTTHDLALAHVAAALAPRADNVHFEDHLEHGRMVFDYRMRPGVVEKSNALALMRAVGLEV